MKINTVQKEINRRNKAFKNATKAEKRVLIAKDVIAQVKTRRFIPKSNIWTSFKKLNKYDGGLSLRETLLSDKSVTCNCCALGSIMTSCTLFNNRYTNGDIYDYSPSWDDIGCAIEDGTVFKNGLKKIFTKHQLKLIEMAFERGSGYFNIDDFDYSNNSAEYKASNMFTSNVSDRNRLIAIMENIIKNNGTFKP